MQKVRIGLHSISALLLALTAAVSLAPAQRQVAITIDDLPRAEDAAGSPAADRALTVKLLASFKSDQIPLTGFVNECRRPNDVDLLGLWAAAGADLGNHTCSHLDLNNTSFANFKADVLKGEAATTRALGRPPRFFRYPYLHTGTTPQTKEAMESFMQERGYLMAPVTVDDDDYMFARVYADELAAGHTAEARRIASTYITYMNSIFAFFERWGATVTGHDLKQILLIHASQLNADTMPQLLAMLRTRGYEFISLSEALSDDAYQLPDGYIGENGISWIHRWATAKGLKIQWEPDPPTWISDAYRKSVARPTN